MEYRLLEPFSTNFDFNKKSTKQAILYLNSLNIQVQHYGAIYTINKNDSIYFHYLLLKKELYGKIGATVYNIYINKKEDEVFVVFQPDNSMFLGILNK